MVNIGFLEYKEGRLYRALDYILLFVLLSPVPFIYSNHLIVVSYVGLLLFMGLGILLMERSLPRSYFNLFSDYDETFDYKGEEYFINSIALLTIIFTFLSVYIQVRMSPNLIRLSVFIALLIIYLILVYLSMKNLRFYSNM
jgi:amino acid transporter